MEGSPGKRSIWLQWRPIPSRAGAVGSSLEITTVKNGESFFSSFFTALSQRPHPLTMAWFVSCFPPSLPLPTAAQGRTCAPEAAEVVSPTASEQAFERWDAASEEKHEQLGSKDQTLTKRNGKDHFLPSIKIVKKGFNWHFPEVVRV